MLASSMTGIARMIGMSGNRLRNARTIATENSSIAAWIWRMSGRVSRATRATSSGSAESDSATRSGRDGREYRVGLRDRKLAGERAVADEHPDMIDSEARQCASFLWGLDLVDLHQHIAEPNSRRGDRTP